ncbi:MAG: enoyl-CoA hydratase/isomerase family protein [Proteobacteria bacterium]|nr:enoyl-CoA hydratase/isomerase family protein [Pseudomonadota bacterium]MBU1451471.1 enoyl-CoA hydratase/isomerase family protein [Pseudomonadota bacterium]MBU2470494.1 enoyl-CoA hydratase/isomerase family protein [Pseudomonadota bacterium]MBU2516402.1 enoyl-CoA hydratase/isomerase family protein [Pseudomonadota bacterium]
MELKSVSLRKQGLVGVLTVDNPPVNALSPKVRQELLTALEEAAGDDQLRCLILTGAGEKFFLAGADIKSLAELDGATAYGRVRQTRAFLDYMQSVPKPLIAAINGACLGGGLEVALCCDIRLAATHARLGFPEVKLGIMPGAGGTQRLPRLVGQGAARRLIFEGGAVSAGEACRMGLVEQVVEPQTLMETAMALAQRISKRGPLAVKAAKRALNAAAEMPLSQGLDFENTLWGELFDTKDQGEGFKAFLEGRPAVFTGK